MKIEKICEYLNDIGLLQLNNISTFLKIYSNINNNKQKNELNKIILALFSYISSISKNEQQLYDICKNIINSFTNNQIVHRYRGIKILNNIFKSKLSSRYNLFLFKLNLFLFKKYNKNIYPKRNIINNDNELKEEFKINTQINFDWNKNKDDIKKGKIINKKKNKQSNNNINELIDKLFSDKEDEYNFTPEPKPNYKSYKSQLKNKVNVNNNYKRNINLNYNYDNYKYSPHTYNYINEDGNNNNISFKNNINYGHNNEINNEIYKLYNYYHNYDSPNKAPSVKYKSSNKKNNFNPIYSNRGLYPNNVNYDYYNYYNNYNNLYYPNYGNNYIYYDFYRKEQDHVKKVEDKIFQLKVQKYNDISEQCTFNPQINKFPKYCYNSKNKSKNKHLNRSLTSINIKDRNFFNINNINNDDSQNIKEIKIRADKKDYLLKKNKKNRPRSFSASKLKTKENKKELSIDKKSGEQSIYKIKENKNDVPNVKNNVENKNLKSFDERQKKYIEEKQNKNKEKAKEKEKEKQKEDLKQTKKHKINSKEVVKRLYDEKINNNQNKIKKEEEKPKKKIIDWDKKKRDYNKLYPNDFNNKNKNKKSKESISIVNNNSNSNNNNDKKSNNILDFNTFSKKEKENDDKINIEKENIQEKNNNEIKETKKNDEENINNKDINNKDIKNNNEDVKTNEDNNIKGENNNFDLKTSEIINEPKDNEIISSNIVKVNDNDNNDNQKDLEDKKNEIKESKNFINDSNIRLSSSDISLSINLEEKRKQYENNKILSNLDNKNGIKSNALQNIINNIKK